MSGTASFIDEPASPLIASGTIRDYIALMKPRVMSLVLFTALAGMIAAPGHINPVIGFTAMLAVALASGASGALNMWYDRDIDGLMSRTKERPLPAGRLMPDDALAFGLILALAAVVLMGIGVNLITGGLLAFTIWFYAYLYSMVLKRRTAQNIVIGGLAGALPPLIGWTAVTGTIAWPPLLMVAIIFAWTPPHFWALAIGKTEEYRRAAVPMLPVVKGEATTRRQIALYSVALVVLAWLPYPLRYAGIGYFAAASVLNLLMLVVAWKVWRRPSPRATYQLFGYSIFYLFALFAALAADSLHG